MSLLPVAEAQARLLAMAPPLPAEAVPLAQAMGRWAIEDIGALRTQPACDLSAMDGYAIRFADIPGPWVIIGESAAGAAFAGTLRQGEAVRIYTGAVMPEGADTVVMQEDVTREGDRLILTGDGPGERRRHVRAAGSDFRQGQCLIPSGACLTPRHIALATLAGWGTLSLPRLPRIALLSTGSELVPPGAPAGPDQIPASNGAMLAAMLAALPCSVDDLGIITDELGALTDALQSVRSHDIVVTTGGASVGDHDLVRPALEGAGGAIDFWKIGMRPGKPLICGRMGGAVFLGLPGNPVSAYVTATLFLLPLVRSMTGCPNPLPATVLARLGAPMPAVGGRDDYVRGLWADGGARPLSVQDSAATLALAQSNCLIRRAAASPAADVGEQVEILPL